MFSLIYLTIQHLRPSETAFEDAPRRIYKRIHIYISHSLARILYYRRHERPPRGKTPTPLKYPLNGARREYGNTIHPSRKKHRRGNGADNDGIIFHTHYAHRYCIYICIYTFVIQKIYKL